MSYRTQFNPRTQAVPIGTKWPLNTTFLNFIDCELQRFGSAIVKLKKVKCVFEVDK